MPSKLQFYSEFAERTARQITGSYRSWTAFLATAARLYKYPYNEQLMIYAQRPNATACAEYDFWKDRMGRYVQRGSTGIALIDTSGYQPRLRYVFDVADTAPRDAARSFTLWEMRAEHEAAVSSMLTEQYDVPQDGGIIAQFERVADKLALEYWTEQKRDIRDIVADSFLSGYDEDNIRMVFKTAASTSITYALMTRCGFSPDGYFEPEDFMPVFDFNTSAAVSVLGTAVSEISQRVLRQIEITVKRQERERRAERTEEHGEQPDLQDQRRISDSRPEPARESAEPAARQVRTDAADVSPGASPDPLESDDSVGNAVSAPAGDRRGSEPEVGADDARADEIGRSDGGTESRRPDEMGGADEHLQGASRGSDPRGTDLRITEPVQGEQISFMLEAENVQTSSASPVLDYNSIKEMHPDDIVLYQVGDFFEIYGEDATQAAELLEMNLTTRNIPGAGRVEMCGLPSHNLEMYVEKLRDKYDVTIAEAPDFRGERNIYTLRSINHEAEAAIDAHEAEFSADGTRVVRAPAVEQPPQPTVGDHLERFRPLVIAAVSEDIAYRNACGHSDRENAGIECNAAVRRAILGSKDMELIQAFSDMPEFRSRLHQEVFKGTYERLHDLLRPLSQDDIDDALRTWNGNIGSKHAVVRYMEQHGRERETAEWLAHEYGGKEGNNLFIVRAGSPETVELTWAKVQRRIAQLIKADKFYTEAERDSFDDIDPIAIREALAERGIVDGKVVEPEKLDNDPFIQCVMQDTAQVEAQALMERAKGLISDFCQSEYGSEADFSDPTKIGVAYTTVTDDEIPIQVNIDLVNFRLERYLDDEHLETRQYGSLRELVSNELESLDFSDLVHVSDDEVEQYRWHEPEEAVPEAPEAAPAPQPFPYSAGDTVYLEDGKPFMIESIGLFDISLRDPSLRYPVSRVESRESFARLMERYPQTGKEPAYTEETVAVYPGDKNGLPYDVEIRTLHVDEPEHDPPSMSEEEALILEHEGRAALSEMGEFVPDFDDAISQAEVDEPPAHRPAVSIPINGEWQDFPSVAAAEQAAYADFKAASHRNAQNFHITDDALGVGGAKAKFRANMAAIHLLQELELEGLQASPEQQEILSRYVGWGGLADAFDENKPNWSDEFAELYATLSPEEYAAARASTLNAHYTSPTVIKAIYEAVGNMGFQTGNILETSMGVGNFFGCLPETMQGSKLYGVELDSITGRIAKQLYPKADITIAGFETTDRKDFYDLAVGNVPFGQYQVDDRAYNKLGFSIHDYFFAKTLDQVRPGGVIAFVTSRYTMDSKDSRARQYIAERANLLGAIRLPNNAFTANAGTKVTTDIFFCKNGSNQSLQSRTGFISVLRRTTFPSTATLPSIQKWRLARCATIKVCRPWQHTRIPQTALPEWRSRATPSRIRTTPVRRCWRRARKSRAWSQCRSAAIVDSRWRLRWRISVGIIF